MKKYLLFLMILMILFLTANVAFAWHGRSYYYKPHFSFGFIIPPPPVWIGPPVYYRSYEPYYPPYPPPRYDYGYRVWVPGYWQSRWTPYGWERVWIPGYWRYTY